MDQLDNSSVVSPVDLNLPLSFFVSQDKFLRLYNNVRARIDALKYQYMLFNSYPNLRVTKSDRSILYDPHISLLESLRTDIIRVHYNSVICNNAYRDLYSRWKAVPQTIEDHSILIFGRHIPKKSTEERQLQIRRNWVERHKKKGLASKKMLKDLQDAEFNHALKVKFLKTVRVQCLQARKTDLKKRLEHEVSTRYTQGWFLIFNTLTVSPEYINDVFALNSTCWTDYVRTVDRAVALSHYPNWRQAILDRKKGNNFHTYFAVVERGSKTGHLHIHVLHFCKYLPQGSFDPNRGLPIPKNLCLDSFRQFWKFGFSKPKMVRFGQSDAFGKIGWRWPVERIGNKWLPIPIRSPLGIVIYLSKYISSSLETNNKSGGWYTWRTRLSRNLGIYPIQNLCKILTEKKLIQILKNPTNKKLMMFGRTINQRILKTQAYKELMIRQIPKNRFLHNLEIFQLEPKDGLLKKFNNIREGRTSMNLRDGNIQVQSLIDMADFNINFEIRQIESQFLEIKSYLKCRGMSEEVYA